MTTATRAQLLAQIDSLETQLAKVQVEYNQVLAERDALRLEVARLGGGGQPVEAAAGIQLFTAQGAAAGWGPTHDPQGVFKGMTVGKDDAWWVDQVPAGVVVEAFPGGSFRVTAA